MNIVQNLVIFVIFLTSLISVNGFCVPQERNHDLLYDGNHLNDEIYNFSIQTRKSDNCDQVLWIKFFIEWKWKNNEQNYDLLMQEILAFQAAYSSYFNALFQKFNTNPIDLLVDSVDVNMVNNRDKPDDFTEIRAVLKCKSTRPIVSKFLEQDCDQTMRILLQNFRVRQFFLYFQDESVSSEVYYDYTESEAVEEENLPHEDKISYQINVNIKFETGHSTNSILQAQQTRMLQDQFEEIYDDVKNDDMTDHLTRDFYIKNVTPNKKDEFSFDLVAEILFPWIDPKNLSNRESKNYQKLLKDFAEYVEKYYVANPLVPNSKIKCKVDEIIDSFEKIGQHFIAIPNAFIVNFHLQSIGFEIDNENVKLLNGNIFDKLFENFKSEELFKAYERDADDEYFVDRDGFIFDNFIGINEEKLKGSWNRDYKEFVYDRNKNFENHHSSTPSYMIFETSLDKSNNLNHPISTKNVNIANNNLDLQENHITMSPEDNIDIDQNNNAPIFVIKGTELKIKKFSDLFACKNCKILIYANFDIKILESSEIDSEEEDDEKEVVEHSKNDDRISLLISNSNLTQEFYDSERVETHNQMNQKFNNTLIQDFYDQIGYSGSIENIKQSDKSIEKFDSNETESVFKKFDLNVPMWKNIIDTSQGSGNEDHTASKYANELSTENYSEEEPNFDLSSDESPETENFDLYQHGIGASETLPINENYVMINKSNYVKTQIVLTLILAIFTII